MALLHLFQAFALSKEKRAVIGPVPV